MTIRTVPRGAAMTLAALLAAGCGGNSPPPQTTPNPPTAAISTPGTSGVAVPSEAQTFATEFLAAAHKGNPDPAKVTPAFKQLIGPADKPGGFSDWAAEQWLKERLTGKAQATSIGTSTLNAETVLVMAADQTLARNSRVLLRIVKSGSAFLVDWVHAAPLKDPLNFRGGGDMLASDFTVNAFLDSLVTGQPVLAEALMSPALKAKLAPPLNDPLGYNRGMLNIKLTGFRGQATEWKSTGTETAVTGQLIGPAGKERPFTMKLAKGAKPGEYLVEDFDVK